MEHALESSSQQVAGCRNKRGTKCCGNKGNKCAWGARTCEPSVNYTKQHKTSIKSPKQHDNLGELICSEGPFTVEKCKEGLQEGE